MIIPELECWTLNQEHSERFDYYGEDPEDILADFMDNIGFVYSRDEVTYSLIVNGIECDDLNETQVIEVGEWFSAYDVDADVFDNILNLNPSGSIYEVITTLPNGFDVIDNTKEAISDYLFYAGIEVVADEYYPYFDYVKWFWNDTQHNPKYIFCDDYYIYIR